jgi:hypothetical protein
MSEFFLAFRAIHDPAWRHSKSPDRLGERLAFNIDYAGTANQINTRNRNRGFPLVPYIFVLLGHP